MITEKQFLEALEIVKAYQKQVNDLVDRIDRRKQLPQRIEDLDFSTMTFRAIKELFRNLKVDQSLPLIEQLNHLTRKNLINASGFGPVRINEVESVLAEYGIIVYTNEVKNERF